MRYAFCGILSLTCDILGFFSSPAFFLKLYLYDSDVITTVRHGLGNETKQLLTFCLLVSSAVIFANDLNTDKAPLAGSKLFDTLMVFLKDGCEKMILETQVSKRRKASKHSQYAKS